MKSRGGTARSGDVIPYVFCVGDGGETSKSAQADRAKHPDEVRKVGSELKIGECMLVHTLGYLSDGDVQTMSIICRNRSCHQLSGYASQLRELTVQGSLNAWVRCLTTMILNA